MGAELAACGSDDASLGRAQSEHIVLTRNSHRAVNSDKEYEPARIAECKRHRDIAEVVRLGHDCL